VSCHSLEEIEADGIQGVRRPDHNQVVAQIAPETAFFGSNRAEKEWRGIAMQIDGSEPPPFLNILLREVMDEGRFPLSGLPRIAKCSARFACGISKWLRVALSSRTRKPRRRP